MTTKQLHSICFFFSLLVILNQACTKEYSREAINSSTPPITDTTPPQQVPPYSTDFPFCLSCVDKDKFEENRWSFKAGDSFLCGIMDTAILTRDRTAFTFFGPSACSLDTSMIISVYLEPYVLNRNYNNLLIPKVAFYYSKLGASFYPLISKTGTPFSVTIDSYNHQTKMTIGTFTGQAYKPDGSALLVSSGKFKVKLL